MNIIKYIFCSKRYFVFSFICGDLTGYVEIIKDGHQFPNRTEVQNMIEAKIKMNRFDDEVSGSVVICNIFEFKNQRDFDNWSSLV